MEKTTEKLKPMQFIRELCDFCKENYKLFLLVFAAALLIYAQLYVFGATNPDGHWDSAGGMTRWAVSDWQYQLGRWAWSFLVAARSGVSTPIIISAWTIALFSAASIFLASIFRIEKRLLKLLCCLLVVATPMVCASLTYYSYSDVYGWSFLFPVFVIWNIRNCLDKYGKLPVWLIIVDCCLLTITLGLYQSNLNIVFVLLLAVVVLHLLYKEADGRAIIVFFLNVVAICIIACIAYVIVLVATQSYLHVGLPEYRGANAASPLNSIIMLPVSVQTAYSTFFDTFLGHKLMGNHFGETKCILFVWISALAASLFIVWRQRIDAKKKVLKGFVVLLCVVLLPLAANATLIATPSTEATILMIGGSIALLPLPFSIPYRLFSTLVNGTVSKVAHVALLALALLMNYSYIMQVNTDAMAMEAISTQEVSVGTRIVADLENMDDVLHGQEVCIMGIPTDGNYPISTDLAYLASDYARTGLFWHTWDGTYFNWQRMIHVEVGAPCISFCSLKEMKEIGLTKEYAEMSNYPETGSIREINDVVVVKVSDTRYSE